MGYIDEEIINYSTEQAIEMFDALSRTSEKRRLEPYDQADYIKYDHRYYYDQYNVMIGDVYIMIPPEFIHVASQSFSQNVQTLRQENSQKQKTGYHKRIITMDLVFNGMDEINGYKVPGPRHYDGDHVSDYYYVDGLRQLLAQFKCTPFLPITSQLLNGTYGIYTIALNSIKIQTIPGFQNALSVEIQLQEINMMPYLEMPDYAFQYMIDWDLFRAYTQSMLTEHYVYKNLQSLPENKDHSSFRLNILREDCIQGVVDTKEGLTKEDTMLDIVTNPDNYICLVDSNDSDVHIVSFNGQYANALTSIQMSDASTPTLQYLGGMDTMFAITFETTDLSVIQSMEQCQISNDLMARNNPKIRGSVGFVKLDADLVAFCGSGFVFLESVETSTVPGMPGHYHVQMICVSYDIVQSKREELEGFLPFNGKETTLNDLEKDGDALEAAIGNNGKQAIENNYRGLMAKIYQDNYAEWKLRTTMEVYPDLRLPTYKELNKTISSINAFRRSHGLNPLQYETYPITESNICYGLGFTRGEYPNRFVDNGGANVIYGDGLPESMTNNVRYNVFVDPDFYVFYPNSYKLMYESEVKEAIEKGEQSPYKTPIKTGNGDLSYKAEKSPSYPYCDPEYSDVRNFMQVIKDQEGKEYAFNGEGIESQDEDKKFSSWGLVTFGLKKMGKIPSNTEIINLNEVKSCPKAFEKVDIKNAQRGDLLVSGLNYVAVYDEKKSNGDIQVVTSSRKTNGVATTKLDFKPEGAYRMKFLSSHTDGIKQSNPYKTEGDKYPDANGEILKKKKSYLSTTEGYESENSYGSDSANPQSSSNVTTTKTEDGAEMNIEQTLVNEGQIQKNENERKAKEEIANDLKKVTKQPKLEQADISGLTLPEVKFDTNSKGTQVKQTGTKTMTQDEFNSLAYTVATECEGESLRSKMLMSQLLYDKVTDETKSYSGLTTITQNDTDFKEPKRHVEEKEINEAKNCIQRVFQKGFRIKKNARIIRFTSTENGNFANQQRFDKYEKIAAEGNHIYYGIKTPSRGIRYNVKGKGVSEASYNSVNGTVNKNLSVAELTTVRRFGKPIYIKSKHFDTHDVSVGDEWKALNTNINRLLTGFVDECQYSGRARLVRAFPTFLFCILDDSAQWYDGRKLWTNFYVYKPVIDINVHTANDMPTSTAVITVSNTYHNLDRSSNALASYSIKEDKDYSGFNRWLYGWSGMIFGGLKLTNRLIMLHSMIFKHAKLREGARVHLRMGYGSDPMSLAPVINGTVSGVELGDRIQITVTSDGHELIQNITCDDPDDDNCGFLGLFGLGATQEPSNIIANILYARESWINHLWFGGDWFEASEYNIEHFGLYLNSSDDDAFQGGIDVGIKEQYDLLMNIYKGTCEDRELLGIIGTGATFRHSLYMYEDNSLAILSAWDGEDNIVFNQYNMTPWDVFQTCTQCVPEFLCKPEMYQFDSRVYYGLPFDLTKYRYDIFDSGTIYQETKANTQIHYIESVTNIIENQVHVTSRNTPTNAKVVYTRGDSPTTTSIIHSDDTIDHSKQETKIIDSAIVQDYFGPDAIYEFFGLDTGETAARNIGISNLLYGWQKEYQGQLLCLGAPQVKPEDYLMVDDFYSTLQGITMVREVIHSFNNQTGFTTSITPGIIGFCPEQNSGGTEFIMNVFKIYDSFSEYIMNRKLSKENSERYANIINKMVEISNQFKWNNGFNSIWGTANKANNILKDVMIGKEVYDTIRFIRNSGGLIKGIKNIAKVVKLTNDAMDGIKFMKSTRTTYNIVRNISRIGKTAEGISALTKASKIGEAVGAGLKAAKIHPAVFIVSLILDLVLGSVFDYLKNRNVVVLLPMWWEADPFISGVKDGEKILLIPAEGNGTSENTGEDGYDKEDKTTSVEDN